ncbi:hypothetical protein BS78_K316100 [Paspalum vaginatum]|uniref:Uncharacterized protein n=1 Tax=Paspalum vaginatum TaxID=158149 RepID=A0A9W7XA95_9POAL|nr:hypothetical protein BS78_K316100 [Paspalum vaginatum]
MLPEVPLSSYTGNLASSPCCRPLSPPLSFPLLSSPLPSPTISCCPLPRPPSVSFSWSAITGSAPLGPGSTAPGGGCVVLLAPCRVPKWFALPCHCAWSPRAGRPGRL